MRLDLWFMFPISDGYWITEMLFAWFLFLISSKSRRCILIIKTFLRFGNDDEGWSLMIISIWHHKRLLMIVKNVSETFHDLTQFPFSSSQRAEKNSFLSGVRDESSAMRWTIGQWLSINNDFSIFPTTDNRKFFFPWLSVWELSQSTRQKGDGEQLRFQFWWVSEMVQCFDVRLNSCEKS